MSFKHFYRVGSPGWWLGLGLLGGGLAFADGTDTNLASLLAKVNAQSHAGKPRLPSIIFIQCDSLGYLDLSCNGQKQFVTPNLDRLAAGGMLFTNYDAGGADGPTARAAFLLGRETAKSYLAPEDRTVAQLLKANGYHTGLIGEWDFGSAESGNAPWQKGFDEFAGYFNAADAENYYANFMWRYAPHSHFNATNNQYETYIGQSRLSKNDGGARQTYVPDLYAKAAQTFVKNNHPYYANHYQPFFLWLNLPTPRPNQAEAARTGNGMQVPTDAPYSEEAWPQAEKDKAAMIARLDEDVGRLVTQLKSVGMTDNVAIFFSSATIPRRVGGLDPMFFPSVVSTNDIRLPMIAWWPQHFPTNTVSGYHWTPGEFLATAAQMGLTDYPTNEVESSILPVLYGRVTTQAPEK